VKVDRTRPFFGPEETNLDVFAGYSRKLWKDKIDWRVQLNVRNVIGSDDLIAINAQPDGSIASYRLPPERRWFITNTSVLIRTMMWVGFGNGARLKRAFRALCFVPASRVGQRLAVLGFSVLGLTLRPMSAAYKPSSRRRPHRPTCISVMMIPPIRRRLRRLFVSITGLAYLVLPFAVWSAEPARVAPTRIYIGNDDHTDYMWATDADTYDDIFVDMLDFHLGLTEQTLTKASPFRNRFNTDGSLWLWHYERKKSPAEFARLMSRIKDGYISSPLNTIVSCYGGQPVEAVLRGMYYAGRLERRFGLRFPLATATENQTLPLGLASLFAGAGAHYSWRGVCGCANKIPNAVLAKRPREIYWYAGHDGQRLLMKWYSLALGDVPTESGAGTPKATPTATVPRRDVGTYIEARNPRMSIEYLENDQGFRSRHVDPVSGEPYRIMGVFGFGGDALARKTGRPGGEPEVPGAPGIPRIPYFVYGDHFHVIAEEKTTPQREVVVSDIVDFFKDFESQYGRTLDPHAVTYGNEWDLYSASMAETSARAKRTVEKLRAAELMATLVSLKKPDFMTPRTRARDQAFTNLGLYWEHNWTADGQISNGARAAWQEQIVTGTEYYVDSLHADALLRLSGMIAKPANTRRFFVLNPLGWKRSRLRGHGRHPCPGRGYRAGCAASNRPGEWGTLSARLGHGYPFRRLQGIRDSLRTGRDAEQSCGDGRWRRSAHV
jgi:hypothetical protein